MTGSGTALGLMVFANTVCVGAFGPLLPEIARAQHLADWQLGLLAGSFGFARMIADVPPGSLRAAASATSLAVRRPRSSPACSCSGAPGRFRCWCSAVCWSASATALAWSPG